MFQHTAARRRLGRSELLPVKTNSVSTHSRPKAAGLYFCHIDGLDKRVSTHSRPKAAGLLFRQINACANSFNTQPPEGGWAMTTGIFEMPTVSTHSRPKAAGKDTVDDFPVVAVSTHSRPKAAGISYEPLCVFMEVSTHSRPKAAGPFVEGTGKPEYQVSTHSRPKAAGFCSQPNWQYRLGFNTQPPEGGWQVFVINPLKIKLGFNTQPPEGGWW